MLSAQRACVCVCVTGGVCLYTPAYQSVMYIYLSLMYKRDYMLVVSINLL